MDQAYFITAVGTPLGEEEELHEEGLRVQLADQVNAGINGIFVAGSMGAMQLLAEATYCRLVERAVELTDDTMEVLVGAGDTSFARTRDRIVFLNQFAIDGIVVLAPYFWKCSQKELLEYYRSLADISTPPLYLYDLPQVTGTKLSMETLLELAKHPNIAGVKASCEIGFVRCLIDAVGESFRVIVANGGLVDMLLHHGMYEQLEGMFAIAPRWTVAIGQAAAEGDWEQAARCQRKLSRLKDLISTYGFGCFTNLMNARGIPGRFVPRPLCQLSEIQQESLLQEPIAQELLREDVARSN